MNLPHLVHVPCLRALTTRRLAGRYLQVFGRETDWAFHAKLLAFGTLDELPADLLQRSNLARSESNANFVDLRCLVLGGLLRVLEGHFGGRRFRMCRNG